MTMALPIVLARSLAFRAVSASGRDRKGATADFVNAGLKLLHSPERKYLSLTGIGLSIDPHSGVPPNSDAVVRGCGQTGGRCLGFRLCLTVGCV